MKFKFPFSLMFSTLLTVSASDNELIAELQKLLSAREGRQSGEFDERLGNFEECTLVGFEFKKGEECNEVSEIECYPANVTKMGFELRERCNSIVDKKCSLVTVNLPEPRCHQTLINRCETVVDVIEETVYKEDCRIEYDTACHQEYKQQLLYPGYEQMKIKRELRKNQQLVPVTEGCYPVPRKECAKVPVLELKKIPRTKCHPVPEVECGNVLTPVTEVVCEPVVTNDCRNISVEVPYIKEQQQCDEVVYDECQEIEKRVPVDICKRRRFDEDSIFLSRGKVFRKEGELRRRTVFRRNLPLDRQQNSTSEARGANNRNSSNKVVIPINNNESENEETTTIQSDIDFTEEL